MAGLHFVPLVFPARASLLCRHGMQGRQGAQHPVHGAVRVEVTGSGLRYHAALSVPQDSQLWPEVQTVAQQLVVLREGKACVQSHTDPPNTAALIVTIDVPHHLHSGMSQSLCASADGNSGPSQQLPVAVWPFLQLMARLYSNAPSFTLWDTADSLEETEAAVVAACGMLTVAHFLQLRLSEQAEVVVSALETLQTCSPRFQQTLIKVRAMPFMCFC